MSVSDLDCHSNRSGRRSSLSLRITRQPGGARQCRSCRRGTIMSKASRRNEAVANVHEKMRSTFAALLQQGPSRSSTRVRHLCRLPHERRDQHGSRPRRQLPRPKVVIPSATDFSRRTIRRNQTLKRRRQHMRRGLRLPRDRGRPGIRSTRMRQGVQAPRLLALLLLFQALQRPHTRPPTTMRSREVMIKGNWRARTKGARPGRHLARAAAAKASASPTGASPSGTTTRCALAKAPTKVERPSMRAMS